MKQFFRRYFVLFPIAALCFYDMFFVRRNEYSRHRENKFGGKLFEQHIVGPLVTKYLVQKSSNMIYKQNTEEVKLVQ